MTKHLIQLLQGISAAPKYSFDKNRRVANAMKLQFLVLWIASWSVVAAAFTSTPHVICDPIVAGKGDAKVEINLKKGSKDTPVFAFRYLELLQFPGLPTQLQFYDKDGDGTFHGVIDPRLNTFIPKGDEKQTI